MSDGEGLALGAGADEAVELDDSVEAGEVHDGTSSSSAIAASPGSKNGLIRQL